LPAPFNGSTKAHHRLSQDKLQETIPERRTRRKKLLHEAT